VEVQIPTRTLNGLTLLVLSAVALAGCGARASQPEEQRAAAAGGASAGEVVLTPETAREGRKRLDHSQREGQRTEAQVVELQGAGSSRSGTAASPTKDGPSPGAPTDAEVRAELRDAQKALANFRAYLNTTAFLRTGAKARVLPDGTAIAPQNAPEVVKRVILAANEIAKTPYKWGGGHGAWRDNGYDCSGSVSFALAGAGLLDSPMTSGAFVSYGAPGPGRWITIYANNGHIFMYVAGLRFDTSGQDTAGTRWQDGDRPTAGFAVRHIPGL
jgi:cell wall-associated NlpC family hydrolase